MILYLPEPYSPRSFRILEEPALHIIGDHLWHSSIVLSLYILRGQLDEYLGSHRQIVELGAGCGLVALALAARLRLLQPRQSKILATDLLEVVESTLKATLAVNEAFPANIDARALNWGDLSGQDPHITAGKPLTIFASDVLYNADSHHIFLATVRGLSELAEKNITVFIAYRHRIAGDDGFWSLAKEAGLIFQQVYSLADIQLWKCNGST